MRLLALLAWALLPGCGAVMGPAEVRGFLGGSLSITCTYERGQEKYPKFWCKPKAFSLYTCAYDIVITSESKPEAQEGRYAIRDNDTLLAFTVTVDNLSKEDAGTFRCGVRTSKLWYDKSAAVKVIVYSASSTLPSLTCTTITFSDLTLSVTGHTQTVSQGEIVQSTSNPSTPQVLNVVEHILIPAVIVVLLLLVVAAGVLVILSRKKKALSSTDIEMDKTRSMSPTDAGALDYADINHGRGAAESPNSNAGAVRPRETPPMEYVEVRQSARPLEEETEALYAKVQKPVPRQEQIYANVPAAARPGEELYSTVWGR
ncbi:CMRF35-like molecule 6 isoform X2 [Oenanthe melanoleuca]|uniref:CMRF35-like molecule 6 isoform X2 n=1 Tax=Oenanthe melanoleuca TaxID=2939378 RepID=UPI0024C17433|nr:CMRF35-like molecule 6 isoform X2 [Oenanthe melanoleuca]